MTKKTQKPAGNEGAARAGKHGSRPKREAGAPGGDLRGKRDTEEAKQARARAREERRAIVAQWCELIAAGKLERFAALGLPERYTVIRGWVTEDPELAEMLADAHAKKKQALVDTMVSAPDGITLDEKGREFGDASAALRVKVALVRLEREYREEWAPGQRTEISGPGGAPIKQETQLRGIIRLPPSALRPEPPEDE